MFIFQAGREGNENAYIIVRADNGPYALTTPPSVGKDLAGKGANVQEKINEYIDAAKSQLLEKYPGKPESHPPLKAGLQALDKLKGEMERYIAAKIKLGDTYLTTKGRMEDAFTMDVDPKEGFLAKAKAATGNYVPDEKGIALFGGSVALPVGIPSIAYAGVKVFNSAKATNDLTGALASAYKELGVGYDPSTGATGKKPMALSDEQVDGYKAAMKEKMGAWCEQNKASLNKVLYTKSYEKFKEAMEGGNFKDASRFVNTTFYSDFSTMLSSWGNSTKSSENYVNIAGAVQELADARGKVVYDYTMSIRNPSEMEARRKEGYDAVPLKANEPEKISGVKKTPVPVPSFLQMETEKTLQKFYTIIPRQEQQTAKQPLKN